MSEVESQTPDIPRERGGLLGLLRRLFGGGRKSAAPVAAPAELPPVEQPHTATAFANAATEQPAGTPQWQRPSASQPEQPDERERPARPAAWEGPLTGVAPAQDESTQPVGPDPWENPPAEGQSAPEAAEPPAVETSPPPVSPVPPPPGAADEEGTIAPERSAPATSSSVAPAAEPVAQAAPQDTPAANATDATPGPTTTPAASQVDAAPTSSTVNPPSTAEQPAPATPQDTAAAPPPSAQPLTPTEERQDASQPARAPVAPPSEQNPALAHRAEAAPTHPRSAERAPAVAPTTQQPPAPTAPSGSGAVTEAVGAQPGQATGAPAASATPTRPPAPATSSARPLTSPLERARAALEEARRQMPGLMADAQAAQPQQPVAPAPPPGRAFAADWPGLLEGLRQAREGLAGEVNVLRSVVNDLRREVGRLSDVVTGIQNPEGAQPQGAAALGQTLPRLQAMLEQLRAVSGAMEGQAQQPFLAANGAPLTPPVRVEAPHAHGMPPTLPEIVWTTPIPHEHVYVPQPGAAAQQPAPIAAAHVHAGPAAGHGQATPPPGSRGPATLLTIAPVEGLTRLSALERRLAATSGVLRLELGGYRRGEASFRVVLAPGASIHDVIRSVPDATTSVAEVRLEENLTRVRLAPRATPEAAAKPS